MGHPDSASRSKTVTRCSAGSAELLDGLLLTDAVGRSGEPTVPVGVAGHHGDEVQALPGTQLLAEEPRRCARPEVLVFHVHQLSRAFERLQVGAGDAALAVAGERVRRSFGRVCAQHLYRLAPRRPGVGRHRRQRLRAPWLARAAPEKRSPRVAVVERRRVLPALAERPREVADGGTVDFELNVMPWGSRPVARIEIDGLLVAPVALVVAAAVAQVDPTDERHVPVGRVAVADHEQLLVVAAVSAHTLVEQNLAAGLD